VFAGSEDYVSQTLDYTEQLINRFKSKTIIETSFFKDRFIPIIEENNKVFIYGQPGVGKTVLLMLLAKRKKAIYISLRNRPLMYVLVPHNI
jgi:DNA replication protein DnaC